MNKFISTVASKVGTVGAKALFKIKKVSPELLIGGGIVVIVTGTVLACKATKKAEEIIEDSERAIEDIKCGEYDADPSPEVETALIRKEKVKLIGRMITNYAIPAACLTTGIAMILASHGIMRKRQTALLTAYNALDAAFKKYRERVLAEENGRERDRRYLTGDDHPTDDIMNANEVDDINRRGLQLMNVNSPYGPYTFEYSKWTTQKWAPDALSNLNTIRSAEEWANRQLRLKGHLFLNDVLNYLDMDQVPWGQLVGWIRGSENGDNYIQIMAVEDLQTLEFDTDGWKKPIFLEFNCDGAIWEDI